MGDGGKIVVGLCTFNRNEQLREALDSLANIELPAGVTVEFVLVDNDKDGGARHVFDDYERHMPFPCHYFVEPNRGLTHVRNRVLEEALKLNPTAIATFDDDEIVDPRWLVEMYNTYVESDADGVSGVVYRLLPNDASELVRSCWASKVWHVPTVFNAILTNNCLFSARLVDEDGLNLRYDPTFNFSGGEDVDFALSALLNGATFAHCPSGIAMEKFPRGRCTLGYLLKRWYHGGMCHVSIARRHGFGMVKHTIANVCTALVGPAVTLSLLPFSKKKAANALFKTSRAIGWLCGIFGKKCTYYHHYD
jgi:glycosyltransferase involved in cell wall biosynthesis